MTDSAARYFSTSEEQCWVNCRLAHKFQYDLRYAPSITNSKLSLGTIFHVGFEHHYLEVGEAAMMVAVEDAIEERKQELADASPKGAVPADLAVEFVKDSELVRNMVKDYPAWARAAGVDEGYDTVSVEEALVVKFPGTDVLFRGKLDLLQRSQATGRLRVVDAKTRKTFYSDTLPYQLSEQNGNYQLAVMAQYGERPTEMEYREARKMNPVTNPRSKPPYYRAVPIRLTAEEMTYRAQQFARAANAATDPDRDIYANPGACCGSWKNDWSGPCQLVHQGLTPEAALLESPQYQPKDPYQRYADTEDDSK
jgi:RecB family exonuclease